MSWVTRIVLLSILFSLSGLLCCSCIYRMPDDDELAIVPLTNNPEVVNVHDMDLAPGVGY